MTPDLLAEIRAFLPLVVEQSRFEEYALYVSGPGWRLRVSGPWRLIKDGVIETSSGSELRPDMSGRVTALVGLSVLEVDTQSKFSSLDVALVLSNETILETFSENIYDDWLLTIGNFILEGPVYPASSQTE